MKGSRGKETGKDGGGGKSREAKRMCFDAQGGGGERVNKEKKQMEKRESGSHR